MRVSPGPPLYQYGAHLVGVRTGTSVFLDVRVRYLGTIGGSQNYGMGLRRHDGWLVMRTPVTLEGAGTGICGDVADTPIARAHLRTLFPTKNCVVQLRHRTDDLFMVPDAMIGTVVSFGGTVAVNELQKVFLLGQQAEYDDARRRSMADAVH